MRHYSAELQTAKQTLTTSKNSIEFTYSDFPCHLKVNRDKLVLINHLWKCKKDKKKTSSIAAETLRSTSLSDSIVRQTSETFIYPILHHNE